jgi:HK97 gp10 family phage protein
VSVISLGQLTAELAREATKANMEASQVVRGAAFLCQRVAVQRAPVDTGFLRSSITVGGIYGETLLPGALAAQVGPEAAYGGYVEFGTAKAGAQPYLTPAAEQATEWMVERMQKDVGFR